MITYGNLWEKFISKENFEKALENSQRGKKKQKQVIEFNKNREFNLEQIRQSVIDGTFHTSNYKSMTVYEPKKRIIYKLPYAPDRIVQHATMNILRPILSRKFIADSYACIEGRGQIKAVQKTTALVRKYKYCLKCDIRKFYPSINHDILYRMLADIISDRKFLHIVKDIVYSFEGKTNAPIGNYTSQWFGNLYLTHLDWFVKQVLHIRGYVRYCDDFILFHDDKKFLHKCRIKIEKFINKKLLLKYSKAMVFATRQGVDFCGYRTFGKYILLRKSTAKRLKHRIKKIFPHIPQEKAERSLASSKGWLKHCNSYNFRKSLALT
jgi:hypothetical protein